MNYFTAKIKFVFFYFFLFSFVSVSLLSCSNSEELDVKVETNPENLKKLKYGLLLISNDSFDRAIEVLDKLKDTLKGKEQLGVCYNSLGLCYSKKQEFSKSLENFLFSANYFLEAGDSTMVAQAQVNSALCFKTIGIYDRAADIAIEAKTYFEKDQSHELERAVIYNLLGNIYNEVENYEKAIDYHQKSLQIRSKMDQLCISPSTNNLGNCYFKQGKYELALQAFKDYKNISCELKNPNKQARAFYNIAKTQIKLGNLKGARESLDSSSTYILPNDIRRQIDFHLISSDYYYETKIEKAEEEALIAYELSQSIGVTHEELQSLKRLASIKKKQKKLLQAYTYANIYNELNDNITNNTKSERVLSFELLAQLDKNKRKINSLEQSRQLTQEQSKRRAIQRNFLILFCVMTVALLYVLYKSYLEKKKFVDEYFASETGVILKSGQKLSFDEILRVETYRNDLVLITNKGQVIEKSTTLKSFLPSLPKLKFGRPQRGIIVNFSKVTKVLKTKIEFEGEVINLSVNYKDEFLEQWDVYLKSK